MSGVTLVAVDLSHPEHHQDYLTRAKKLADLDGAMLAVVTVIPDFGMSIVGSFFDRDAEQQAINKANEMLHDVVTEVFGANPPVKHVVRHGPVYEEILATAEELGASLIVLGAHKPNYQDFLIGPNAARVVRHSRCSVYIIRD